MAEKKEKAEAKPGKEAKPAKEPKAIKEPKPAKEPKAAKEPKPVEEAEPVVAAAIAPKPKKPKNWGRFAPKNKSRLPRKLKKARAKAARTAQLA
jgi:hypothetical protein